MPDRVVMEYGNNYINSGQGINKRPGGGVGHGEAARGKGPHAF